MVRLALLQMLYTYMLAPVQVVIQSATEVLDETCSSVWP